MEFAHKIFSNPFLAAKKLLFFKENNPNSKSTLDELIFNFTQYFSARLNNK